MDIKEVLLFLEAENRLIFDHEKEFMEKFGKGEFDMLINVSFYYLTVNITYLINSGKHVCDAVMMADYMEWRDGIKSNIT